MLILYGASYAALEVGEPISAHAGSAGRIAALGAATLLGARRCAPPSRRCTAVTTFPSRTRGAACCFPSSSPPPRPRPCTGASARSLPRRPF